MTNDIISNDKSKDVTLTQNLPSQKNARTLAADSLIGIKTLPVVVHIIHNNGHENISNQQVATAIAQLNNGFQHNESGIDMQFSFCLAKQDPNGNPSSGINRIQSTLTSDTLETDDHSLKQLSTWDPTRYINVWVVKSINSYTVGIGQRISGYATMPVSYGSIDDGIVVEADFFGTSSKLSQVVIHNFGHYLGLYHTFEGGCKNNNCLNCGDMAADTPPDEGSHFTNCTTTINRCNADYNDMSVKNPFRFAAKKKPGDKPNLTTLPALRSEAATRHSNYYSATITDNSGSNDVHITFNTPYINAGPDISICRDELTFLKGEGTSSCAWFDASGNQIGTSWELPIRPLTSTFYVLKVNSNRCYSTDTVMVNVTPICEECTVDAGQDQTICSGQTTVLHAVTNGHCTRNNCASKIPFLTCENGCINTLAGAISANINQGQTACVKAGTSFTGTAAINGGTLIICGYADLSNISFNSGRIIIYGAADFSSLEIGGTLENHGDIHIKYDCIVNSTGELQNFGYLIVDGSFSSSRRTSNYSTLIVSRCFTQNGADVFTNECTFSVGSDLQCYGTLINNGTITVDGTGYLNSGSQFVADDGSILSAKNIYFNSHVEGGSAGYASITVELNTFISGEAVLAGLLDICDKNGIELNSGSLANTVTTDCRCIPDNHGGTASFVWTDPYGNIVGFGKQISVKPTATTVYTVSILDVNGNSASDHVAVIVENCN